MHRTFVFPIRCEAKQELLKNIKIARNHTGEKYIVGNKEEIVSNYDPFKHIDIIPSLNELIKNIDKGGNEERLICEWVHKWGHLKGENIWIGEENGKEMWGESLFSFKYHANMFVDLWNIYRAIIDDEIEKLNEYIGKESQNYKLEATLKLLDTLNTHIRAGKLGWSRLLTVDEYIEIEPGYIFYDLIDVLFMQFFILLSENKKKICPQCSKPFLPSRRDKKYCSNTCKLTAKSQRYRNRKMNIL